MKRFTLLTVLLILCISTFAQLRLAVLGGPHGASILEKNSIPGWDTTVKPFYSKRSGFHVGFLADVPLDGYGKWYLQPGLFYMAKGRKYFQFNDTVRAQATDTLSFGQNFYINYVEIPINLAYKIRLGKKSKFVLSAGPYLGFFYSGKSTSEIRTYSDNSYTKDENNLEVGDAVNKIKTLDFGVNARAGFELGSVLLSGFFSQGLSNFYQASYDGSFKHRVIGASFGFWLNKAAAPVPKIRDKDKDGIPDKEDACPELPGTAATQGCPDKDADGIADQLDKCPDIPGLARYNGCPIPDSDKDGINDEDDKCPNLAGTAAYKGCPVPDSDGDGIDDEKDSCRDKPGLPEYQGCPITDRDGDGINDKEDKCPDSAGTRENNGCPEIRKEIVERINYAARSIFFALNSDKLLEKSFPSLDEVADILKNNPALKLYIDGHTDNVGNPAYNMSLSQKRAEAVKKYIAAKAVDASRLEATGYGQEKPAGDNKTAAGRAMNRRVELRLEY